MLPAVVPITAAGLVVGLLVLAAATMFWAQRRRRELTVLSAHGVGAAALGAKAVLEVLPAVLVGTLAGWAGAWVLVRSVGPDPVFSREAAPLAAIGAAAALLAGLLVAGLVATLTCRSLTDQSRTRHHALPRRIPWELAMLAAAPVVWRRLGDQRSVGDLGNGLGSVAHIPGRLLIVPIMVVAGLSVLTGRVGAGYLRRRGVRHAPRTPAAFLSWRRIGRQAAMTAVLAGATAVPIALAAYGATVTGSVRTTIADESRLYIGSDVILSLADRTPIPASLAGQATEVLRLNGALVGGILTDLLAVDPASFARDAYWDDRLDGDSLSGVLAPLRDGGTIVAAAPTPGGRQQAQWGGDNVLGGTVQVIQVNVLPAQQGGYPVALVPEDSLGDDTQYAKAQLWVRGDPAQIRAAAQAAHLPVTQIQTATEQYANTVWEPLTYTFDYLTALSLLTGVVTVVGLLLYLESQTPTHRRAYVLLRRMGLSAGSHRRALLGELAVPLIGGLLGGLVVTAGLTAVLSPDFEMNPTIPPDTVLDVPYLPLGLIAGAVLVVALGGALYAQRRIGRANPAEVLRDTV
jgi:putative ABC transport system permease protein